MIVATPACIVQPPIQLASHCRWRLQSWCRQSSRLNFILASSNRKVCGQTHLVSRLGQSSRGRAVLGVAAYKAQVIKQAFWSRHFTVESLGATNFN
ncbi:hypothetical protein PC112_g5925 [Phytophthora cactorum]|nr:hypothetical protein PC112_g5925 [Phytophthora cactorum]